MQFFQRTLLAFAAFTVIPGRKIAKAQDLTGLPDCAKPALIAAFQASGCSPTDAACLCNNPNLVTSLQSFVSDACDPADQAAVLAFAETYCGRKTKESTSPSKTSGSKTESSLMSMSMTSPAMTGAMPTGSNSTSGNITMPNSTMTNSTMASSTSTSTSTSPNGGAAQTGLSMLIVAVGGMGWLFAEF